MPWTFGACVAVLGTGHVGRCRRRIFSGLSHLRLLKATRGRSPFLSPLPWDLGASGAPSGLSHISLLSFGVGTLALMTGTFTSPLCLVAAAWPEPMAQSQPCQRHFMAAADRWPLRMRPDVQGLPGNLTISFLPPIAPPPAPDGQRGAFTQLGGGWQAAVAPGQLALALW